MKPTLTVHQKRVKRISPGQYKTWLILAPGESFEVTIPYKHMEVRVDQTGMRAIKVR
jgi:hypothetical protein